MSMSEQVKDARDQGNRWVAIGGRVYTTLLGAPRDHCIHGEQARTPCTDCDTDSPLVKAGLT